MSRRILGPFNRVEGDLEVRIEVSDGQVEAAYVNSPLFRGFEQILHGKDPRDALVYTPRICGICSVSQSVAAATALAAAMGLQPVRNGQLATNLILACENAADHLTHFYLFFMPDFARNRYAGQSWYEDTHSRFAAQSGRAAQLMLKARAEWLHLIGILAGKWPHSLALQPGGSTRPIESPERARMLAIIGAFRLFLERRLFGDKLEAIAALHSAVALQQWCDAHPDSDFGHFLMLSNALELERLGQLRLPLMSYGAYPALEDQPGHAFDSGLRTTDGAIVPLDPSHILEDISHSWMSTGNGPSHPYQGTTIPLADFADDSLAYSWCKAPRLENQVIEVGALARQAVNQHPLVVDLLRLDGTNVRNRVTARLLELALIVPLMEQWVRQLCIGDPYCSHAPVPDEAQGAGMVEAARGSLGHWLRIKNGRILNYQIIAPTTWNFSPRDSAGTPGALEQALVGAPAAEDDKDNVEIAHIVRSFDPCMVCTVH